MTPEQEVVYLNLVERSVSNSDKIAHVQLEILEIATAQAAHLERIADALERIASAYTRSIL